MKHTKLRNIAISAMFIPFVWACSEEVNVEEDALVLNGTLNLPATTFNYADVAYPAHFYSQNVTDIDNTPSSNQITDDGATLGRVLFYDKKLSANNTVSCASCHLQSLGFADDKKLSTGFEGGLTGRNSMGLSNAKFYDNGAFFWDQRANTLEIQTLMPIQDHVEMGLTLDELVTKVQAEEYYQFLFKNAFGEEVVNSERISKALAQFVRSMVSFQSKYDEGLALAGGDLRAFFSNFTQQENMGKMLFASGRTNCSSCHETAMFSGDRARKQWLGRDHHGQRTWRSNRKR